MSKFEITHYGDPPTILKHTPFEAIPWTVPADGVAADANGRKIVPAGTILPANDATAKGVLLSPADVTYGDAAGAIVVNGYIDLAKVTDAGLAPTAEAKTAMPKVTFE